MQHSSFLFLPSRFFFSAESDIISFGLDDWDSIPGGGRNIFGHRVQIGRGAHPASYPTGTGDCCWGAELTTHLHLVQRLRICVTIPPLHHYVFMAWWLMDTSRGVLVKHRDNFSFIVPCSRVLLEKLMVTQLVKKFPAFYGTRRFITVFTIVRNPRLLVTFCTRVRFPAGAGNFSLHHGVQNGSGAHPASYSMSTRASSLGVKRLGREADHSPPSSAEVKE
jgi:hypothetical protein